MTIMTADATNIFKAKNQNLYTESPKYIGVYLSQYYAKGLNSKFRNDLLKA